ncbi:MAG: cytochrome P450 [Gammaproteobacteria bacterium]
MYSFAKGPPGPGGFGLLTFLLRLRRDPLGFLTEAARRYGDLVFLGWVDKRVYLLNHPRHIKYVLQENAANYTKGPRIERLKPLFGEGLTTSEGEHWRRQHRIIQPMFRQKTIAAFAPLIVSRTRTMLERWQRSSAGGRLLDIAQEMRALTQGIMVRAIFGQELVDSEATRIGQALCGALKRINERVWALFDLARLPTPGNRELRKHLSTLDRFVTGQIAEKRRTSVVQEDLLSLLLGARSESGAEMSDSELRDEALTLWIAGHTTLAAGLTWTWYLLSQHPAVAEKLEQELEGTLGDRIPRFEDLVSLPYTRMLIEEALRLYPPTWILARSPLSDDTIGGYRIPRKSVLLISPYLMHRHPDFWASPEAFDPERFRPERSESRARYAYLPFGGGQRGCLGKAWALMEMQLIVATVAQKYRLRLGHGCLVAAGIVLSPKGRLLMTLESAIKGNGVCPYGQGGSLLLVK